MALKSGKIITVSSVKGGVGKTTTILNLAGIYSKLEQKVLVIDFDLYSGGIATSLNIDHKKDIFMLIDAMTNNRFTTLNDYVTKYNPFINVLSCPKDPRQASKVDSKYIKLILDLARNEYDVILVDTSHILDEVNLHLLDLSYMILFVITNDIVDLKNMKSLITIFKDTNKTNYLMLLNNSRDTGKDYLSMYDIKNVIKNNIDYTLSKSFYIKNIDKYILKGEILTLNKRISCFNGKDIGNLKKLALDLIDENHKEVEENHKKEKEKNKEGVKQDA